MDVKLEVEIKDEELEINSHNHDTETFPDSGTIFTSPNSIKIEEPDETLSIKSELREIKEDCMLDKEQVKNDVIKPEIIEKSGPQYVKIFPDSGTIFASQNSIKIEEPDETLSIKSELREIKEDCMLDKKQVKNDVIKPEIIGKSGPQYVKSFIGVAGQGEQGSKVESSNSRPLSSVTFDQAIKENCQDYLRCRFCNFTFKNKDELTSHLKTHDKRNLKCAHCGYECNWQSNLKPHLLTHSNLKLFKCSACNYECNFKSSLKRHLLTDTKNISVVKIAIEICNNSELKREILCASGSDYDINKKSYKYDRKRQWDEIVEKKAVVILENLGLLKELQREVIGIVLLVGMKMLTWAEYHEGTLGLSREYCISFLSSFFFTSQGIIDNKRAAEGLMKDDNLSIKQKYKLACLYCFTEHIPTLFKQLTKEDKEKFYDAQKPNKIKQPELVKFWFYYQMGEIDKLKGEKSLDQYRLEKAVESGSKAAVEFCLEKANLKKRRSAIIDAAIETVKSRIIRGPGASSTIFDHIEDDWVVFRDRRYKDSEESWIPSDYYVDILHFLISKMRDDQKIEFLKKDIEGVNYKKDPFKNSRHSRTLEYFLNWPYQDSFMKTAKLMWEILPERSYADLLLIIYNKIESKKEENLKYGEEKSFDYRDLLKEFWRQSPEHYKRYVFSNTLGDTRIEGNSIRYKDDQLLSKLLEPKKLTSSIDKKNIELIELILNDATPEEKKRVISSLEWGGMCNKLILEEKWELLEELIEKCTSSTEEANQFKKGFFLHWDALSYLIMHDKFFLMDEIEKWSTKSEEETKEHKRERIFSQRGKGECFKLIMEDKLEFADKFVRWSLSSDEEIKEFKKEFVYSFGCSICEDLIAKSELEDIYDERGYYTIGRTINFLGGKWEQVEMFLTWAFSSEEEISEFKSELLSIKGQVDSYMGFVIDMHLSLVGASKWEEAKTFFAWLDLSEEKIKELKKETLFSGLGMEGINEWLYVDYHGYFSDYAGGRWEAIELFLRWCLTDKKMMLEFKNEFDIRYGFKSYEDNGEKITEKEKTALDTLNVLIEELLNDLVEEQKKRKSSEDSGKDESSDLPNKKLCSAKIDQQTCNKHLQKFIIPSVRGYMLKNYYI